MDSGASARLDAGGLAGRPVVAGALRGRPPPHRRHVVDDVSLCEPERTNDLTAGAPVVRLERLCLEDQVPAALSALEGLDPIVSVAAAQGDDLIGIQARQPCLVQRGSVAGAVFMTFSTSTPSMKLVYFHAVVDPVDDRAQPRLDDFIEPWSRDRREVPSGRTELAGEVSSYNEMPNGSSESIM